MADAAAAQETANAETEAIAAEAENLRIENEETVAADQANAEANRLDEEE